jgi:hypothetical protein
MRSCAMNLRLLAWLILRTGLMNSKTGRSSCPAARATTAGDSPRTAAKACLVVSGRGHVSAGRTEPGTRLQTAHRTVERHNDHQYRAPLSAYRPPRQAVGAKTGGRRTSAADRRRRAAAGVRRDVCCENRKLKPRIILSFRMSGLSPAGL